MKRILYLLPLLLLIALPACEPTGEDGVDALQLGLVVATLPNRPNLRVTNSSGIAGSQVVTFFTTSNCTGTAVATFTVANGSTATYTTVDAGTYYASIGGVGCSSGFQFTMGTTIAQSNNTCTSSSAVVAGITCLKTN